MGQRLDGDGLAQWRGKETPLVHRLRELPTDSSSIFPRSWNLTCVSHFLSLTPAFPNIWTRQWNQQRREVADKTLHRKGWGWGVGGCKKKEKNMRKCGKKLLRNPENNWNLVDSDEDRWEKEPRNEIQNAGVLTLLCKHPWNPSSLLPSVGVCRSWHVSSSGVCINGAKPPGQLRVYMDVTWFHKIAFLAWFTSLKNSTNTYQLP